MKLIDNSDISLPILESWSADDTSGDGGDRTRGERKELLANVAMRAFVIIGKQVFDWTMSGIKIESDGVVHRDGSKDELPEAVPYDGWN